MSCTRSDAVRGVLRRRVGQDLLGLVEAAQLVQGLAHEQAGLGCHAAEQRRLAQPLDLDEVLAVAGQPGGLDEEGGIGPAGGLEARGGDADGVLPPPGAVPVDAVGEGEEQAPAGEGRHATAEDLAVEGVGQRDLLPAALGAHGDQPGPVEVLERLAPDRLLQRRQPDGLPHRQGVQRVRDLRREAAETSGQQLVQARCGDERADQAPDAPLLDELAPVQAGQDQLPDEEDVALAGRPQLGDGAGLHRPAQDQVHQRVDGGTVQVVEVDPPDPGLVPQRLQTPRHALGRTHGGDQEEQVGVDELAHQRGGGAVEEVQVVDEEHERSGAGLVLEHRADLRHHRHQVATLVAQPGRQEVGQRAERHLARTLRRRGPGHVAAGLVGEGQALVGQAGLADARRPVDDEAVGPRVGERVGEQLELLVAADEGPLQRGAGPRRRGRASPGHRDHRTGLRGQPSPRPPSTTRR